MHSHDPSSSLQLTLSDAWSSTRQSCAQPWLARALELVRAFWRLYMTAMPVKVVGGLSDSLKVTLISHRFGYVVQASQISLYLLHSSVIGPWSYPRA